MVSSSIGQGLGSRLGIQQVEAHKHGRTLGWRHGTLIPEAKTSAHSGAQLSTLHGHSQLGSALDAQLLRLHSKERTAIGLRSGESQTHAEDVVEPEGVAKVRAPVEELLSTPTIITCKLFVEANTNG